MPRTITVIIDSNPWSHYDDCLSQAAEDTRKAYGVPDGYDDNYRWVDDANREEIALDFPADAVLLHDYRERVDSAVDDLEEIEWDAVTADTLESFRDALGAPAEESPRWAMWEARSLGGRGDVESLHVFDDGERRYVWSSSIGTFQTRLARSA
jgi:hypothetical protein